MKPSSASPQPEGEHAQPALLPELRETVREARSAGQRRARRTAAVEAAEVDPIAEVLVDVPIAHLDRGFDYLVPAAMADAARPGVRVKVRFAGQDVDGFVIARKAASEHPSPQPIRRVVSAEPVLRPDVLEVAGRVAAHYAGTRGDVLRLAVPPRHASVEKQEPTPPSPPLDEAAIVARAGEAWGDYEHAAAFCERLATGQGVRAVWSAMPGADWPTLLALAAASARRAGRGVLLCVPDHRDLARLDAALLDVLGPDQHVTLQADAGPSARYRAFLAVARGARRVVAGTRAAIWAPVHDLGLVVLWDDGDDLLAEPRAPYPHTREVAVIRAQQAGAGLLLAGAACSVEALQLVERGWARPLAAPRARVREAARIEVLGADDHALSRDTAAGATRLPTRGRDILREGLAHGPVLVQTPRGGYAPSLACERCRTPARCAVCTGPLRLSGPTVPPECRWCGHAEPAWRCGVCGHRGLRAPVRGEARTAEELGRMFPGAGVLGSARERVIEHVDDRPAIVVATPGAEPVADGGYAAVVLLDAWLALSRVELRGAEEALRRWMNAAALVRPGGAVAAVGDPAHAALQALVRWDAAGFARREAEERTGAHLPPGARLASLSAPGPVLEEAVEQLRAEPTLPDPVELLGPVPVPARQSGPQPEEPEERMIVLTPARHGAALASSLGALQRLRSARKLPVVRVQLDPPSL